MTPPPWGRGWRPSYVRRPIGLHAGFASTPTSSPLPEPGTACWRCQPQTERKIKHSQYCRGEPMIGGREPNQEISMVCCEIICLQLGVLVNILGSKPTPPSSPFLPPFELGTAYLRCKYQAEKGKKIRPRYWKGLKVSSGKKAPNLFPGECPRRFPIQIVEFCAVAKTSPVVFFFYLILRQLTFLGKCGPSYDQLFSAKEKRRPPPPEVRPRDGHVEHVCKTSGFISQKRRGHFDFWA